MKAIYTWLNLFTLSLATTLRLTIPPSSLLPNPAILPASTHATLTTAGTRVSVPVRAGQADFLFRVPGHVSGPDGQYILTIDTKDYVFRSYRVDVDNGKVGGVWEVTRGVPWDRPSPGSGISLGGGAGADADAVLEVGVLGRRAFFEQRATCMSSPPFPFSGPGTNANSLAAITLPKSDDFTCCRCVGTYIWHAQVDGE